MFEKVVNTSVLAPGQRFKLVRYFTFTALGMIALVALVLTVFLQHQGDQLHDMQAQESKFFADSQAKISKAQEDAALRDLLQVHEAGNVNLTRLFANALWNQDFAPFVAQAREIPVDDCRAIADVPDPAKPGKTKLPPEKVACFAEVGAQIQAIPGFSGLHDKVFDSMKNSTVFKIKVFDLRGITVYSSELKQVGEDKSTNAGWLGSAKDGKPMSELTHRDKFSAFEGVVENRDLISSYLPVFAPGSNEIVGVFEVYSDVTPFLAQIKKTSADIAKLNDANEKELNAIAGTNESQISSASLLSIGLVLLLLLALFAALFYIVRRADAIIVSQEVEREQAQQNLAQSEKMASLGQMVAGVAHQLNTPIAFSSNNVGMAIEVLRSFEEPLKFVGRFADVVRSAEGDRVTFDVSAAKHKLGQISPMDLDTTMPTEMLQDTLQGLDQMRELVENLRNFTRLDRSKTAKVDLNKGLHTVVYLAKSVIPTTVHVEESFGTLPEIECNVSQLNQVFLNLINNAAQAIPSDREGRIVVSTQQDGEQVVVKVADNGTGIPASVLPHIFDNYYTTKKEGEGTGLGLPIAKSIVEQHGGSIQVETAEGQGTTFVVRLPVNVAPSLTEQG